MAFSLLIILSMIFSLFIILAPSMHALHQEIVGERAHDKGCPDKIVPAYSEKGHKEKDNSKRDNAADHHHQEVIVPHFLPSFPYSAFHVLTIQTRHTYILITSAESAVPDRNSSVKMTKTCKAISE